MKEIRVNKDGMEYYVGWNGLPELEIDRILANNLYWDFTYEKNIWCYFCFTIRLENDMPYNRMCLDCKREYLWSVALGYANLTNYSDDWMIEFMELWGLKKESDN